MGSHFCTSSILDKNWIITAAHCVINHPPNEYQVRCGSLSPNKQPGDKIQIREVKDIVIHEDYEYDYQAYPNDVALIHLAEPLDLSYEVWPSYVARKDNYDWSFSKCYSVGWGQTGKCWDANTWGKQWAADGHGTKHRADMEWQCPISCGMCKNAGDSDYLQEAQTWAFNYPGCSGKWSYNQINKNHICAMIISINFMVHAMVTVVVHFSVKEERTIIKLVFSLIWMLDVHRIDHQFIASSVTLLTG